MPQITTWDRRLYFPSEGSRAEDFFALKIQRLRPSLNSRTRVPETSTLTPRAAKIKIFGNKTDEVMFIREMLMEKDQV